MNKTGIKYKLTPEKAREIRCLYATGLHVMRHLAERFKVSLMTVSRVVRGEIYPDAGGPISKKNWNNNTGNTKNFWWYK